MSPNPENRHASLKRSMSADQIAAGSEHNSSAIRPNVKKGKKKKKRKSLSSASQQDTDTKSLTVGDDTIVTVSSEEKGDAVVSDSVEPRQRRPSGLLLQKQRSKSATSESTPEVETRLESLPRQAKDASKHLAGSVHADDPSERPGLQKRSKSRKS